MIRSRALIFVLFSFVAFDSACASEPVSIALPAESASVEMAARIPGAELRIARGAEEALEELSRRKVRFALAQEDALREFVQSRPDAAVRVVGRIYFEYLHILVRRPLRIETASGFRQLRIWAGGKESGSQLSTARFLGGLGIPLSSVLREPPELAGRSDGGGLEDLPELFRKDRLDVAMVVAAPANQAICRGLRHQSYTLSPLDYGTLRSLVANRRRLSGSFPQSEVGHLPAKTYPDQDEPIAMVAVPVWLAALQGEDSKVALSLLATSRHAWSRLAKEGLSDVPLPEPFPGGTGLAFLDRVKRPDFISSLRSVVLPLALPAGLLLLGWMAWRKGWHRLIHNEWRRDRLTSGLAVGLGSCVLLITIGTYLAEREVNENFSSIRESFWSITIYLFSGLEDRTPYTAIGRVIAALGLLLGPAFFAVLSGWLARFFMQREKRMPQNLRDHYLFLNWNDRAVTVARELHHPILVERYGTSVIVVLTDNDSLTLKKLKDSGSGRDEAFEDFYLSVGDPTSERALLNANAQDARTILIFADADQGGDERTIRSLMMLRRIARDRGLRSLHVIAELLDAGNEAVLDEIARDFPGLLERVSGTQVRTFLLAQAALNAGMVQFYLELLQISAESNEVYALPIPASAVGLDFRDYAARVLQAPLPDPLTPVGIQRPVDGRVQIVSNPRPGCDEARLREGDRIIVLSYLPPQAKDLPIP